MDYILPFVNIAFAFSAVLATRRLLQRYNSTNDATPTTNNDHLPSNDEPPQIEKDVKICMVCRSDESKDDPFIKAPCGEHFVCANDIAGFFEYATNDESLYPPKCCGRFFLLDQYRDHIPADIASAYHSKEQGEYSILAKDRLYCANPPCARFLHPSSNVKDELSNTTYAICKAEECSRWTCVHCKTLLDKSNLAHPCHSTGVEENFKQIVLEKGYQRCFACGATVELTEACNHIRCICGTSFCYICAKPWTGFRHGCPSYGPAIYDAQGYNQIGFHRDTGLNRTGLTGPQQYAIYEQMLDAQHQVQPRIPEDVGREQWFPWLPRLGRLLRISMTLIALFFPGMGWLVRVTIILGVVTVPSLWEIVPATVGDGINYYDDLDVEGL